MTIPIEAPKPAAQDIPKVTVDVTAVEKTLTPTSLPISQVTDQPAPGAEELGLKPGQTAAVVPQQPKQSLLSKWVRLFFQKKAPETTEPVLSDVERETKPLVMTPSLMEEPLDRIGRSVSVVSAEQIEAQGSQTLIEGIRNVPGVSVRQMGSLGDFSSIRIRGTRPWDTAILMEGMPLRDASDPQGSFLPFTEDLFTGHVSQIEVMRGTGSTLYGSEAIGGVINMRMKQGIEGRPHVKVELDGGTFGTIHHAYQV
ncbi:MAG: TonB-dependent receptor, partial [Candidatus Omnitrophica bacterium]|nr:TonB-dependent receptor [Candidatus Omnitrophota bacterium]